MNLPISVKGKVVRGKNFGHTMGIPTANLVYDETNPIKYGVYGSYVYFDGKKYLGVTNVGIRPSIDNNDTPTIETYILNFNEDIRDKDIEVSLEFYIRDIKKFSFVENLKRQIDKDIKAVKEKLGGK